MNKKIQIFLLAILMSTLTSVSYAKVNRIELMKAADKQISGKYVRERFLALMNKPFAQEGKQKALILGDSHAQDFLNSVLENSALKDYQISTRYIPVRCQMFIDNNAMQFIASKDRRFCAKSDSLLKAKNQIAEADLVILVSNWKEWAAKLLPQTINKLELEPSQRLFIVGRKSFGNIPIRKYLRMSNEELASLRNKPDSQQLNINELMSQSLSKDIFIDLHSHICGETGDCPVFTSNLELISFDGGHLTKAGASYVGKILFRDSPLSKL
jgi:hypothetical protein